ncbi:MAG: DUF2794 domain-containing protein [Rhizobiaceae bacterium]|nr:DUF2794 domain-containing protein [Rhizobiaceae bacterium]
MRDRTTGSKGEDESAILIPFPERHARSAQRPVAFDRRELDSILRLYGRMVAANEWRDYAIDHTADRAVFSVFRRASESPLFQIVKNPSLARKQGAYAVISGSGQILKRGYELGRVLGFFDKKLRLIEG